MATKKSDTSRFSLQSEDEVKFLPRKKATLVDVVSKLSILTDKASSCGAGSSGRQGFTQGNSCARGSGAGAGGSGGGKKPPKTGGASSGSGGGGGGEKQLMMDFDKAAKHTSASMPKTPKAAKSAFRKVMGKAGNLFKRAAMKIGAGMKKAGKSLAKKMWKKAKSMVSKEASRVFGSPRMAIAYIALTSSMVAGGAIGGTALGSGVIGGLAVGAGIALYQTGGVLLREMLADN